MPKFIPDIEGDYILYEVGDYMCKIDNGEEKLRVPSEQIADSAVVGHQIGLNETVCEKCESERMFDENNSEYYCPVCR